jgi:hypothetical protein
MDLGGKDKGTGPGSLIVHLPTEQAYTSRANNHASP